MIKNLLLSILLVIFFITNLNAFDIRNINKSKIVSQASYELNNTNLIDNQNAYNLLDEIHNLNQAVIEKGKEIIKRNKNR